MQKLRILYLSPLDFPDDVADCDGSCVAGDGPPCLLHAGLCCPDDSLDTIMSNPDVFSDELLEDLLIAAALPPPHRGVALPAAAAAIVAGEELLVDVDAGEDDVDFYSDRDSTCSNGAPRLPVLAALSDTSWTTSSTLVTTESSSPAPAPPHVSRLVMPTKKRDMAVKRGKRLWSLEIPSVPESRDNINNNLSGNGGDKDDGDRSIDVSGDGGGGLLGARPPANRRRTQKRACRHCESTETPQWRVGPDGPGTLCNACGIRYTKNKLLPEYRPSTSPSFRSDKHSNRHRKVVRLREKKVKVKEETVSVPPAASADRGDFMDVCKLNIYRQVNDIKQFDLV
ncbi:hypothetical protein HU200_046644 [Digitaria exilis]|uniref:GATA-type domain-containing protein n=1 Tax=Digitaria exilis TaxID=1010633 RepID=A0A835B0T4_9POAL|nr:hypothetical protein HU200_046644 [Digitaria exilis]